MTTGGPRNSQLYDALPTLFKYLSSIAKSSDAGLKDIAVQEYTELLRTSDSRKIFWSIREETVDPLFGILRSAAGNVKNTDSKLVSGGISSRNGIDSGLSGGVGLQLLYHALLAIWQLSFEGELVGSALDEYVIGSKSFTQLT